MNTPNAYRVYYKVMEGDNYAGGWVTRQTDITRIGSLVDFDRIQKVVPIYVEIGEPLSQAEIDDARDNETAAREQKRRNDNVQRAQEQLSKAQAEL